MNANEPSKNLIFLCLLNLLGCAVTVACFLGMVDDHLKASRALDQSMVEQMARQNDLKEKELAIWQEKEEK